MKCINITWIIDGIKKSDWSSIICKSLVKLQSLLVLNGIFHMVVVTQYSTKIENHIQLYILNNSPQKTHCGRHKPYLSLFEKCLFFSLSQLCMIVYAFPLFYFFDWTDLCPIFQSQPTDKENKMTLSDTFMWNLTGLLRMQRLVREELVVRPERKDDIYSFSGTKTRPNTAIPLGGFDHTPWLQANRFDVRWEGRGELWVRD